MFPADKLGDNPDELFPGVDVKPFDNAARRSLGVSDDRVSGLLITDVAADSPVRDILAPNMVIIEINRTAVSDLATAKSLLRMGRNLVVVYFRGAFMIRSVTISPK